MVANLREATSKNRECSAIREKEGPKDSLSRRLHPHRPQTH
jgi:hypothetical protein